MAAYTYCQVEGVTPLPWEQQREYVLRTLEAHDKRLEAFIQRMEVHCDREDKVVDSIHDRLAALEGRFAMMQAETQAKFDAQKIETQAQFKEQKAELRMIKFYAALGGALTVLATFGLAVAAQALGLHLPSIGH